MKIASIHLALRNAAIHAKEELERSRIVVSAVIDKKADPKNPATSINFKLVSAPSTVKEPVKAIEAALATAVGLFPGGKMPVTVKGTVLSLGKADAAEAPKAEEKKK